MTYGGLKNCSNATYMPRNISVIRKNLPRVSNVDSFFSSHLGGLVSRKPLGGAPEGVAYVRCATILAMVDAAIGCRRTSWRDSMATAAALVEVASPCMVSVVVSVGMPFRATRGGLRSRGRV